VNGLGAADEADGGGAEAVLVEGFFCGLAEPGVVGEAEVVIGAHVDDLATIGKGDVGVL